MVIPLLVSFLHNAVPLLPCSPRERIIPAMSISDVKNDPAKVQLVRLAHVYFEHPDLETFARFAMDFGLVEVARKGNTIYFRGYGKDPYVYVASTGGKGKPQFLGPAFVARDQENFDKAARIPGAIVKDLDDAPGGGKMVTIPRPNDTFMHIIYGQKERDIDPTDAAVASHSQGQFNTPFDKPRQNRSQTCQEGPAVVHKLGHFGYVCKEFDEEVDFYTSNFNIIHSDILWHPKLAGIDVLTFMRLDLGKEYSDHHVMFLQRAPPEVKRTYLHHTSYEVADFDTQLIGHDWLAKRGWKSVWGVGRHILGSQIFDYWQDSSGFKMEHYSDGDVVNEDSPTGRQVAGALSVWGPEIPKDFELDGTAGSG